MRPGAVPAGPLAVLGRVLIASSLMVLPGLVTPLARAQEPHALSSAPETLSKEQLEPSVDAPEVPTEQPRTPEQELRDRQVYERLIGQHPDESEPTLPQPLSLGAYLRSWGWLAGLAILGGAAWFFRRRMTGFKPRAGAVEVISQVPLGRGGLVALLRVEDEDGRFHRILVGLGGSSPTLLTDLGAAEDLSPQETTNSVPRTFRLPPDTVATPGSSSGPSEPDDTPEEPEFMRAAPTSPQGQGPLPSLIAEVLAEKEHIQSADLGLPRPSTPPIKPAPRPVRRQA